MHQRGRKVENRIRHLLRRETPFEKRLRRETPFEKREMPNRDERQTPKQNTKRKESDAG